MIKKIICLLLICAFLQGCVYWKVTIIRLRGAKIRAPIGSYTPVAGDNVKGTIARQVWITDEKGREAPDLKDFLVKEKGEGESTDDAIEVKK